MKDFSKLSKEELITELIFIKKAYKVVIEANKELEKQLFIQSVSHCFFYDNELNHIRQWFITTIDQNQDKDIEKTEWKLGLKIHKCLNITPENRIVKNCC